MGLGERLAELGVDPPEHHLREVEEVRVRRVRPVVLEHRELGIVPGRDALVAVAATDLVDALEAADEEALQVELRRDPHEEVHVERVVVRLEGASDGAADERRERRGLDLEEALVVEHLAGGAHDVAARAEHLGDRRVGDEVDVPLAVASLDVLEAVPLLGRRPQGLREDADARRLDGELAALRCGERALGLDEVADVDVLERGVGRAHRGLAREELELARAIAEAEERETTRRAERDDAAAEVERGVLGRLLDLLLGVLAGGVLRGLGAGAEERDVERDAPGRARDDVVRERVLLALAEARGLHPTGVDEGLFGGRASVVRRLRVRGGRRSFGHGRGHAFTAGALEREDGATRGTWADTLPG